MNTQRVIFKWLAMVIAGIMLLQSALILPSASAQGENTPTPTGCNAGPCSVIPSSSTSTSSLQSFAATGSVTGITDPTLIPNPSVYDFSVDAPNSAPTSFPGGTFSGDREVRVVGSPSAPWGTWNPQINGKHVLFAPSGTVDILFTSPQMGVVVKAEPNYMGWFNITIEAFDSSGASLGSFTQSINGDAGASFLGVLSTSDDIAKITLSSDPAAGGFAFSDMTYGSSVVSCSGTPDTFEPDDTSATGSPIIFGEVQRHNLCPQNDQDWISFQATDLQPDLLVETFDLEPDSINPNGDTQLTVKDSSGNQIGTNQDRGLAPPSGSVQPIVQSSRVAWHPATAGLFNINIFPETPINEQAGTGYSLHMANPFMLIDPVAQGSWAPTKVSVPTVWRSGGNVIYFSQMFVFEQAELEALINLNTTLAWEFRRPAVDTNTGQEEDSNVDFGDYWKSRAGVCVGDYWTNLPNPTDEYSEETNLIPGCEDINEPGPFDDEEFEVFVDDPSELIAGKVYWVVVKFYVHSSYLNNNYQFYIAKAEHCKKQSWPIPDEWCNVLEGQKSSANLIEGYLQPAP